MTSIRLLVCLFAVGLINIASGQTGPAGIRSSSTCKVWLDASQISSASNGSAVSLWDDASGNGNHMAQLVDSKRPIFQTNQLNGKPGVYFSSNDRLKTTSIPSMDGTSELTWLLVANNSTSSQQYLFNANYSAYSYIVSNYCWANNFVTSTCVAPLFRANYSESFGASSIFTSQVESGKFVSLMNNTQTGAKSISSNPNFGTHNHFELGCRNNSYFLNGQIFELIIFSVSINAAERNIVNNYLSSKYGLAIANDYYTHDATHGENLIGLGEEIDGNNIEAVGQGIVTISNPDDLQIGEYFFLGDDDVSLANTSTDVPTTEPIGTQRFERVWRVGENQGNTGNVTIILDVSTYRPGTNPSTIKMCVDTDDGVFNDAVNAFTVSGVYDGGAETVTFTVDLDDGDFISFCGSESDIESTGVTSDWSLTTTWNCGCIPSLSDSVTIVTGHTVNVDDPAATARTIYVQTGATLDFTGGYLTVEEDFKSDGSFNVSNGTFDFNGPSVANTMELASGAYFDNFDVSTSFGATLIGGPYIINGTFTMNGNIDNSSASGFVINSTSSGDGRIAAIPGSISFSDTITVRRYVAPGLAGMRNVTPSTFNFYLSYWDDDAIISGDGFPDGCALQGGSCWYSVKYFNGTAMTDITDINQFVSPGSGLEMFLGDDLSTYGGGTLESSGTIRKGTWGYNGFSSWNLIGNAYPSQIDFDALQILSFRMDDFYYIYDANDGAYRWYDQSGGTGDLDQYIAMGQAFWVLPPTGATQPLQANWNELMKTNQTATFKNLSSSPALYLKVSSSRDNFGNKIAFTTHPNALVGLDTLDIPHLVTPEELAPYIATKNEYGDMMTVSVIPSDEITVSMPVLVNTPYSDYYTVSALNIENFEDYSCIYLLDLKTNEAINLRDEGSYTFFVDQAKSDETRFLLVCSNDGSCDAIEDEVLTTPEVNLNELITIQQVNNFFNVNFDFNTAESSSITVLNTLGQIVYESGEFNMAKGTKSLNLNSNVRGVHFIKVQHGNQIETKKVYIH